MSLQLIKAQNLILTRNPAEFVFKIPAALQTEGAYATGYVQFDPVNPPVDGDIWEILFGDNTLAFTLTTLGPDGVDPLKLSLPDFFGAPEVSMNRLLKELYRHPLLSKYYKLSFIGDPAVDLILRFDARNRGAAYTLGAGAGTTVVWLSYGYPAGVTDVSYDSLSLVMRVYDKDGVDLITEMEASGNINADANQMRVTFYELPQVLNSKLNADIPMQVNDVEYSKVHDTFMIEVYEKRGDDLLPMQVELFTDFAPEEVGTTLTAIKAGMPIENFDPLPQWRANEFDALVLRKFLTWQSRTKLITYEQPEWLSLYVMLGEAYYKHFTIYYTDGSNGTVDVNFDAYDIGVVHIPTGAQQNDLNNLDPTKTIKYYTVEIWIVDGLIITSETFTYVIDTVYQRKHRYFSFSNSLGGVDTIRCFGVAEFSKKFNRTNTEHVIDSESRMSTGAMEMVYSEVDHTFTIRTGWQPDRATVNYYSELLHSRLIKEVIMPLQAPVAVPPLLQPMKNVLMLTDKANMPGDDDGTFGLEFNMQYAWKDTQHSNLVSAPEVYFDSLIEFTVFADSITGSAAFQIITDDNDKIKVEVNGLVKDFTGFTLDCDLPGLYQFKVYGYKMTDFLFTMNDFTGDIAFVNIDCRALNNFGVLATRKVNRNYLYKKLSRLRFLQTFTLGTNESILDTTLIWLQRLYDTYGGLATVDLTAVAGGTTVTGTAAYNYLIAEGLTVTY